MTVKQFFKSTVFKCIAVLLCVLLVSGVFLTIMNALLKVTAGEKLQRSISKIYPGMEVTVYGLDDEGNEVVIDSSVSEPKGFTSETVKYGSTSEVSEAYKIVFMQDGAEVTNYLITSKGLGGYDGGSVTCSVAVIVEDGKIAGIYKVNIQSNDKQSFIGRVGDDALAQFSELYEDGISYSQDLITKATTAGTKNAICNAVNGALTFVRTKILGEEIIEIPYSDYINVDKTTFNKDERKLTVVTKTLMPDAFTVEIVVSEDMKIASYKVVIDGTTNKTKYVMNPDILNGTLFVGKGLAEIEVLIGHGDINAVSSELKTSATESNFLCSYAAAFALANFQDYMDGKLSGEPSTPPEGDDTPKLEDMLYNEYINGVEFDKDTLTYTIETKSLGGMPGKFTVEITVAQNKTIASFKIKDNGSSEYFDEEMHAGILDGTFFAGKTLAQLEALINGFEIGDEEIDGVDDVLVTGATRSNFICTYAAAFALANYDAYTGGGTNE